MMSTEIKKFNKIVIWGFRNINHTHRYIQAGFYHVFKKLGVKVIWIEDKEENKDLVKRGDLVISANVCGNQLPLIKNVYYCLHNFDKEKTDKIERKYFLKLQVYTDDALIQADQKWGKATFFSYENSTLYQPWGTSLLPKDFFRPIFSRVPVVFWIGSVWDSPQLNGPNQGNVKEINELQKVLDKHRLRFVPLTKISERLSIFLVRHSRLAPAIGGQWQVQKNYLPCRMFKNISYGQLGFSNIKKFNEIYKDCSIQGDSIEELVNRALSLSRKDYKSMVIEQQKITRKYTYLQNCLNIFKAFEIINLGY